jgi:hypothetical protein
MESNRTSCIRLSSIIGLEMLNKFDKNLILAKKFGLKELWESDKFPKISKNMLKSKTRHESFSKLREKYFK